MAAAVTASVAEWAVEAVREMLQEQPDMTGAEVLARLETAAAGALAERDWWDDLKEREGGLG